MPLDSSPVWGKSGSLHTCGAEIKCQTIRFHGGHRLRLSQSYLQVPKRAFDAVLAHVLHFRLVLLPSIANRPQHRPIVDLQLHRLLRLQRRRWLSGRHASRVWWRAWELRVGSGLVEIEGQLGTVEVTQPYILLEVKECWLSIYFSARRGRRTYTNKWHKNLARVFFLVVDHRFGDGDLGAGTAAVQIPLNAVRDLQSVCLRLQRVRVWAELLPAFAAKERRVAVVDGAQVPRYGAVADWNDEEADMVEPIGRATAEQLHVVTQNGALQPVAAQQEDFDCTRWFCGRVAAVRRKSWFIQTKRVSREDELTIFGSSSL